MIVDTLAAQFYDRLLDVDPYTYRLMPELAESWDVLDNGATYRFHLRRDVPFQKTNWFTPTRNLNADDVVFTFQRILTVIIRGITLTAITIPTLIACNLPITLKVCAKLTTTLLSFVLRNQTPLSYGTLRHTMLR